MLQHVGVAPWMLVPLLLLPILFIIMPRSALNNYIRRLQRERERESDQVAWHNGNLIDSYEDCQTYSYNTRTIDFPSHSTIYLSL